MVNDDDDDSDDNDDDDKDDDDDDDDTYDDAGGKVWAGRVLFPSNSDHQQVRGQCTAVMIISLMMKGKGLTAVWFPKKGLLSLFVSDSKTQITILFCVDVSCLASLRR